MQHTCLSTHQIRCKLAKNAGCVRLFVREVLAVQQSVGSMSHRSRVVPISGWCCRYGTLLFFLFCYVVINAHDGNGTPTGTSIAPKPDRPPLYPTRKSQELAITAPFAKCVNRTQKKRKVQIPPARACPLKATTVGRGSTYLAKDSAQKQNFHKLTVSPRTRPDATKQKKSSPCL